MFNMESLKTIFESLTRIKEKLKSRTFIKAVGKSFIEDLQRVVDYVEKDLEKCLVKLPVDYIRDLVSKYYAEQIRLRFLIKELMRILLKYHELKIKKIYPLLPEKWREIFSNIMYEEEIKDEHINFITNEILKGFYEFEEELKK